MNAYSDTVSKRRRNKPQEQALPIPAIKVVPVLRQSAKFPVWEGMTWISHSHDRHSSSITMLLSWPSSSQLSSKAYDSCQCCVISSGVLCRKGAHLWAGLTRQGMAPHQCRQNSVSSGATALAISREMYVPCSTQTCPWAAQSKPIFNISDSIGSGPQCSSVRVLSSAEPLPGYSVRCTIKFLHK